MARNESPTWEQLTDAEKVRVDLMFRKIREIKLRVRRRREARSHEKSV